MEAHIQVEYWVRNELYEVRKRSMVPRVGEFVRIGDKGEFYLVEAVVWQEILEHSPGVCVELKKVKR